MRWASQSSPIWSSQAWFRVGGNPALLARIVSARGQAAKFQSETTPRQPNQSPTITIVMVVCSAYQRIYEMIS